MSSDSVVSNSSPLIALERIKHLGVLEDLFGEISVPHAVAREVSPPLVLPPWISIRGLSFPGGSMPGQAALGSGEREAILLAGELSARWVIIDDRAARRIARQLGLPVIGTLGILLAAKRRGLLTQVEPCLDRLRHEGFRLADELVAAVPRDAGEQRP